MALYRQFVDCGRSQGLWIPCFGSSTKHPELHDYENDDGSLLNVIYHNCPEHVEAAFQAGLSPDCGSKSSTKHFCSTPRRTMKQNFSLALQKKYREGNGAGICFVLASLAVSDAG